MITQPNSKHLTMEAIILLRASHIKRWVDSTDQERLDENNGLLLAAHIDLAFESGLISFGADGHILLSPNLAETDTRVLGVTGKEAIGDLSESTRRYLVHHRNPHGFID